MLCCVKLCNNNDDDFDKKEKRSGEYEATRSYPNFRHNEHNVILMDMCHCNNTLKQFLSPRATFEIKVFKFASTLYGDEERFPVSIKNPFSSCCERNGKLFTPFSCPEVI